jgi:DsbC/DsbD-like thiol-disulfide interchange protein
MVRTGVALFAIAILAGLPLDVGAQGKKSNDVVKVTAAADKPDANGKQTVTLTITIEKPWHIYANPVGQEDLASAATVVDITGKTKPKSVKVNYPTGKVEKDTVVGNYMIYEGKIEVKADVTRATGDTGPLKASVKVQACTTGAKGPCLLPATIDVEIP